MESHGSSTQDIVLLQTPQTEHRDLCEKTQINPHSANTDLANCWGASNIFFFFSFFKAVLWKGLLNVTIDNDWREKQFKKRI